jgi:nicotinate-nucleotide--dimethylbenzimidazole phosphoribosyltransferase
MAGAILAARMHRMPVILDGFIACSAAAVLAKAAPGALDHCVAGHLSAEGAHGRLLEQLGKEPLLSLGLRLGEGSGAALAIGVVQGGGGLPFRHGHLCRGWGCGRGLMRVWSR